MYCRHCGAVIPDDSVFCSKCGKNVSEIEPHTEEIIPENSVQNTEEQYKEKVDWYYRDEQGEVGPCTQNDIETAIRRGQVNVEGEVKIGQDGQWFQMMESRFSRLIQSLSPKQVAISDKWIWCLAIIPILVSVFMNHVWMGHSSTYLTWIVPVILNVLFIWLDQKELINAGMLAESWMYMGILLVPVYLVVREIKTNNNYSPAIIWCFIFAIDFFIL